MNLYCKACARMPVDLIGRAIQEVQARLAGEGVDNSDATARARAFKLAIKDLAAAGDIDLT